MVVRGYVTGGPKRYAHQERGLVKMIETGGRCALLFDPGCLSGDTEVVVNRAGRSRTMALRDLEFKQNGGVSRGGRSWDESIPTRIQRNEEGDARLADVVRVAEAGIKQTHTLTLANGFSIRATPDHPFETPEGLRPLGSLTTDDWVLVNVGRGAAGRRIKQRYRERAGLRFHPYAYKREAATSPWRVAEHRLVVEAAANGLALGDYLARLRTGAVAGLSFLAPDLHVHHIDFDPKNNDMRNLRIMGAVEHHRLHAELGKTSSVLEHVEPRKVVSIDPFGEEMTYDVTVADDPHTFIANGFSVGNTGKTATALDYMGLLALKSLTGEARVLVVCPLAAVDTWVLQAEQFASPQVAVWAEALGGSIKQRGEALASRGGQPYRAAGAAGEGRSQHVGRSLALYARNGQDVLTARDRLSGGPDALGSALPRLIIEVVNLDTFASRAAHGSGTMADYMVESVKRFAPDLVLVDESHRIKGVGSNTSRALARIGGLVNRRVILTGTVMPHALTLNSPILTPNGWKPMGEMQVGDHVIGSDGQPTEVLGIWPQGEKPIFRVTFSDGTSVECTEDHLWAVESRGRRSRGLPPLVLSTEELARARSRSRSTEVELGLFDKGGSARWALPSLAPAQFEARPVSLDPYLLGVLLGDGHLGHSVDFTTMDEEIVTALRQVLPEGLQLTATHRPEHSRASRYRITSGRRGGSLPGSRRGPAPNEVHLALDGLGLRHLRAWEKFVPENYLLNAESVRLEVLRGLMDSDGTPRGGTSKFTSTSQRLAEDVAHLVRSLGGYARITLIERTKVTFPQGHSSQPRPQYEVLFGLDLCPFRLSRKADQWFARTEAKRKSVVGITQIGVDQTQCITVAAEDGLFVAGGFSLTHNSPMDVYAQWRFLEPYAFGTGTGQARKRSTFGSFRHRYATMGGWMGREVTGFRNLDNMQDTMALNASVARKEDALDLPPTTDVVVPVNLSAAEASAYTAMKKDLAVRLDPSTTASVPNRLAQMMRLRQITSGHLPSDDGSVRVLGDSKAQTIRSIVHDNLAGEGRVVVFCNFTHEIEALRVALAAKGTEVVVIDGGTPPKERAAIRARFGSSDPARIVLVCQIKTMSLAVNELVTASHAVFGSLSYQRDDLVQARDRLNRIGQTKPVTFWYALAPGTVDEVIMASHEQRTSLEANVLRHIFDGTGVAV